MNRKNTPMQTESTRNASALEPPACVGVMEWPSGARDHTPAPVPAACTQPRRRGILRVCGELPAHVALPGRAPCVLCSRTTRAHHLPRLDPGPAAAPGRAALRRRLRPGRVALPRAPARPAAVPRRRGRRRQDRAGRRGRRGARHRSDPAAVLRRARRHPRGLRVGLRAAAPRAAHPRGVRRARSRQPPGASCTATPS